MPFEKPDSPRKPNKTSHYLDWLSHIRDQSNCFVSPKEGHPDELLFFVHVDGSDVILATSKRNKHSVKQAEAQVEKILSNKITEIENKFDVVFAHDQNDIVYSSDKKRSPTWEEIYGIEAAMKHSQPAGITPDGNHKIKFYFLRTPANSKSEAQYYPEGYCDSRSDSYLPAIYFLSDSGRSITENDAPQLDPSYISNSMESIVTHELAHNTENRLGWYDPQKMEELYSRMGWESYVDSKTNKTEWLLKGNYGNYYRIDESRPGYWTLLQKNVDNEGCIDFEKAGNIEISMSGREVWKDAYIHPASGYFSAPREMGAEGFTWFRMNEVLRSEFLKESPKFYDFIKEQDQKDINLAYPVDANGQAKKIRIPNGSLADNTEENRKIIADFEQCYRPIGQ